MSGLKKVLVLGASGMLGSAVFRLFFASSGYSVAGVVRSEASKHLLPGDMRPSVIVEKNTSGFEGLEAVIEDSCADVVINCIGVVKQRSDADDPLVAIPVNALLPHQIAKVCRSINARVIHMSTDCVYSGSKGFYAETDQPDSQELYGQTKLLGELDYPHAVTLRTSIIGHELSGHQGLLEWFLSQEGAVKGYRRAIFSGLPVVELARVIRDYVVPMPELKGVYHVSSQPISKFELLRSIAATYRKQIQIVADDNLVIDRSLDSARFRDRTGYKIKPWEELIQQMHDFR